jgi:hypothetical protein
MGRQEIKKQKAKSLKREIGTNGVVAKRKDHEEKMKKRFYQTIFVVQDYSIDDLLEIKKTKIIKEYPVFDKLSKEDPKTGMKSVLYYTRITKISSTDLEAVVAVIDHKKKEITKAETSNEVSSDNQ